MNETDAMNAGDPVDAKCHLSASGDLTIEGWVEGEVDVENALTVGPNAQVAAQIFARVATIRGSVRGNVTAAEKVVLTETGSLYGDIVTPRIAIADGACFNGSVNRTPSDMQSRNGNGHGNGNRVAVSPSEPTPMRNPNTLAAEDPRDEFRRESNREHDENKSEDVGRQANEKRDAGYRHVLPPPASHPLTSRAEAPSGSVGPYWKRDDVEVPQTKRTLLGLNSK